MRGWLLACISAGSLSAAPDISTIKPDLALPQLSEGKPAAGQRVKQVHPDWRETSVYHVLYLPKDWQPDQRYPVIVEYAGNGPYKNRFGDISTGRPEGSRMGYGISGGTGFIWVCIPYLNANGTANVAQWWGNKPKHDPQPSLEYCKKVVPWVCRQYGGDPDRVVLCGFSRGAIACNFLGLHDDEVATLWCAMIPYSHYDGVRRWSYPGSDPASANRRIQRLGLRPQFICHEGEGVMATRDFLKRSGVEGRFILRSTGFRNHNDAWLLRPSPVRRELRAWLAAVVAD